MAPKLLAWPLEASPLLTKQKEQGGRQKMGRSERGGVFGLLEAAHEKHRTGEATTPLCEWGRAEPGEVLARRTWVSRTEGTKGHPEGGS